MPRSCEGSGGKITPQLYEFFICFLRENL